MEFFFILLTLLYILFVLVEFKLLKVKAESKYLFLLIACLAIVCIITIINLFLGAIGNFFDVSELEDPRSALGTLGDYFGGVLNPIFAFLSFMALLGTLHYQGKQLKQTAKQLEQNEIALSATRKAIQQNEMALIQNGEALKVNNQELINSTEQLGLASKSHQEMEKTQKIQQFENLFFALINQLTIKVDNFEIGKYQDVIKALYDDVFYKPCTLLEKREKIIEKQEISIFFIFLYQILKSIDTKLTNDIVDYQPKLQKSYSNIVRSLISERILQLLMVNCYLDTQEHNFHEFKRLLEKYSFFEHVRIFENDILRTSILLSCSTQYNEIAFGTQQEYNMFKQHILFDSFKSINDIKAILYGIFQHSNLNSSLSGGEQYSDVIFNDNISENADKVKLTFKKKGEEILDLRWTMLSVQSFILEENLIILKFQLPSPNINIYFEQDGNSIQATKIIR